MKKINFYSDKKAIKNSDFLLDFINGNIYEQMLTINNGNKKEIVKFIIKKQE